MKNLFQSERGVVMMEFIIIFPIYLVLFAIIMAIGDMLVHSIRLPSAERTSAFDIGASSAVGKGWDRVTDTLFSPLVERDDKGRSQDALSIDAQLDHSADTTIEGPWSMTSGTRIRDNYTLPIGGAADRLLIADMLFSRPGDNLPGGRADGLYGDLIAGRSVAMYSKDVRTTYNYVTLKRRRDMTGLSWRDNGRYASDLVVYGGWSKVSGENYADGSATESNRSELKGNPGSFDEAYYTRYPQFVTWSN